MLKHFSSLLTTSLNEAHLLQLFQRGRGWQLIQRRFLPATHIAFRPSTYARNLRHTAPIDQKLEKPYDPLLYNSCRTHVKPAERLESPNNPKFPGGPWSFFSILLPAPRLRAPVGGPHRGGDLHSPKLAWHPLRGFRHCVYAGISG